MPGGSPYFRPNFMLSASQRLATCLGYIPGIDQALEICIYPDGCLVLDRVEASVSFASGSSERHRQCEQVRIYYSGIIVRSGLKKAQSLSWMVVRILVYEM